VPSHRPIPYGVGVPYDVKHNTMELPYDVENTVKLPYDVAVPYDVKQ